MKVRVLGTAQDGGSPRPGCECPQCEQGLSRRGPSIVVESGRADGRRLLVDAPPDVRLTGGLELADELLVTHAHVGHYAGLLFLGRECRDADGVPLHCSSATAEWFRGGNKAYHHLVARGNVDLRPFDPGRAFAVCGLTCHPFAVVHRNEDADTVGLLFSEGEGDDSDADDSDDGDSDDGDSVADRNDGDWRFCYLPDLDYWTDAAERAVRASDAALVDGTFFSDDELDGRSVDSVPHPTVPETMDRLADATTEVYFTHLNHTNPVGDPDSSARQAVEERGFGVAEDGRLLRPGE